MLRLPQVKGNHALAGLSSMHPDAGSSGTQARTENGWPADAPCGSPLLDCRRSAGTGRGAGATACSRGSVGGGWAVGRPSRSGARGYTSSSPRAGFGLERFAHAAHGIDPASSTETVIRNCRPHGQRAMMPILFFCVGARPRRGVGAIGGLRASLLLRIGSVWSGSTVDRACVARPRRRRGCKARRWRRGRGTFFASLPSTPACSCLAAPAVVWHPFRATGWRWSHDPPLHSSPVLTQPARIGPLHRSEGRGVRGAESPECSSPGRCCRRSFRTRTTPR